MKQPLNESFIRMQKIAGIVTENQINEGELVSRTQSSGKFKKAVIALEDYLAPIIEKYLEYLATTDLATTGGDFDYGKLAELIIDIKDAGAEEGY